jgi:RNA polymerase sigma-70 factor (ECF subfamily)
LNEDARTRVEQLFRRYAEGVSRFVLLRVGSPELAEEITARVFLAAVRHIDQQRGSPVAWLWAIVRSELSRHYRQRKHEAYAAEMASSLPSPVEELEHRERDAALTEAIRELADDAQQLISLKFFLRATNVEIAATLGLTPTNVGVKVHRALKELRRKLEPQLFGADHE